jgi:hypothetical protein
MDFYVRQLDSMGPDGNGASQAKRNPNGQDKGDEQHERQGFEEQELDQVFHQRRCASGIELGLRDAGAPF